jgi:hypothetical protein
MPSVEVPEAIQALRPSQDVVRVNLGPTPALFLAVENLPPSHLSRHAFFFEMGPDARRIQQMMGTEPWCLLGPRGELGGMGILRPKSTAGGIRALDWLLPEAHGESEQTIEEEAPHLLSGFYGPRVFLFPPVPPSRGFQCRVPRAMELALTKIFGREAQSFLAERRAWIRISMPREVPSLETSFGGISLHAMTASNVGCFNQTIYFEKQGNSIPIIREEGGAAGYLVAPISIFGETGNRYVTEMEVLSDADAGRYAIRNGRIELRPALCPDGRPETYANLRLWVTSGKLGNDVGPGQLTSLLKKSSVAGLRLTNPTSAAGGTDQEQLSTARDRLAAALLSRDRVVTREDLASVVRSFDARILQADVVPGIKRTKEGLQRVEHVTVRVGKDDFVDLETELEMLKTDLLQHLASRFPRGTQLTVNVVA